MSEVISETSTSSNFLTQTPKILAESVKIFLRNKQTFLSIFALTTLPLSFLLASLSLSSRPLRSRVSNLESLARAAATRFEARHVLKESRSDAVSLLYAKSLILVPCLVLSLLASVSAVSSVTLVIAGKHPTLRSAVSSVKLTWKRPLVTSILTHAILLAYTHALQTLTIASGASLILTVGFVVEIYLMAVMSLAIVVSIAEEKFGLDAIRVGSSLMEGRRVCGWLLSGLFVLVTGLIAGKLEGEEAVVVMDDQDLPGMLTWKTGLRVLATIGDKVGLVVLYGIVVLLSYVVFTVFYCECCSGSSRRRLGNRGETELVTVTV